MTASRRCGAQWTSSRTSRRPSYVGEHNFEVYEALANMDVAEVAEGMGDGLFS